MMEPLRLQNLVYYGLILNGWAILEAGATREIREGQDFALDTYLIGRAQSELKRKREAAWGARSADADANAVQTIARIKTDDKRLVVTSLENGTPAVIPIQNNRITPTKGMILHIDDGVAVQIGGQEIAADEPTPEHTRVWIIGTVNELPKDQKKIHAGKDLVLIGAESWKKEALKNAGDTRGSAAIKTLARRAAEAAASGNAAEYYRIMDKEEMAGVERPLTHWNRYGSRYALIGGVFLSGTLIATWMARRIAGSRASQRRRG